eukprot:g34917.t1
MGSSFSGLFQFDAAKWEILPVIQSAELMRGQGRKYPFGVHVSFTYTTIEECKMVMQASQPERGGCLQPARGAASSTYLQAPHLIHCSNGFATLCDLECHDNAHNNSSVCTLGTNSNKSQSRFACDDRITNTGESKKKYVIRKFHKKRNVIRLAPKKNSRQHITPIQHSDKHKFHLKSGESFVPPRKNNHTIRFGSYNVHLARPEVRLEVLRETICHSAIDVLAIQESWLNEKNTCNSVLDAFESLHIKNRYVFINNRRGEKGGGQVLIVHRKLGPVSRFAVNSFIDKSQLKYLEDTQWILIKHLNLVVGNIYLRPTKRQGGGFKSQLKALQSVVSGVAQSANYNIMLLGQVSGGVVRRIPTPHGNTTPHADEFVRNLESVPLVLLTDYCLCSPSLVSDVDNYVTWPQYFIPFSDHKLITVDVKMQKSNSTSQQSGGNYILQKTKYVWKRNVDLNVCADSLPALPCEVRDASSEDILQFFYSNYCPIIDDEREIGDKSKSMLIFLYIQS